MSDHHDSINEVMRHAFGSHRFNLDGRGRLLRGPDAETTPATGPDVPAPLGKSDAGARGHVPTDPGAAINQAIRRALAGRS